MSILAYHAVDPRWRSAMSVPPAAFAQHARWLSRRRVVLPIEEAARRATRTGRLPRRRVALTFDDGFASVYEHAFPLLRELRLPTTVFLVAATLEPGGSGVDWVDDPPPYPVAPLTLEHVLEMRDAGVSFGSHSHRHHDLTRLDHDECRRDLRRSRELLEDLLHAPVETLAYPRGRHDERVRRASRDAGFRYAFALSDRRSGSGPLAIPRAGVYGGNSLGTLRVKASRWYVPLRTGRLYAAVRSASTAAGSPAG